MPHPAFDSIYEAISSIRLIDPHTHINPHSPASTTLADLLGYHYYTELAHSAGMPKAEIEEEGIDPRELVRRLVSNLGPIENTAQYSWLIEICRTFFGFDGDRLDESNWETVYDAAESQMGLADWPQMVLDQSNVEAVFLTNDFDDPLTVLIPIPTFPACVPTTWFSTWPSTKRGNGWKPAPESNWTARWSASAIHSNNASSILSPPAREPARSRCRQRLNRSTSVTAERQRRWMRFFAKAPLPTTHTSLLCRGECFGRWLNCAMSTVCPST